MTADELTCILEAELETGELLADTLDRQRRALVQRDLDRVNEITEVLEGQMEQFGSLVEARTRAMREDAAITDRRSDLLERIRRTEGRVLRLAELNQDLIADRLAWVGAMLSTVGLTGEAGYGPEAQGRTLSRSA